METITLVRARMAVAAGSSQSVIARTTPRTSTIRTASTRTQDPRRWWARQGLHEVQSIDSALGITVSGECLSTVDLGDTPLGRTRGCTLGLSAACQTGWSDATYPGERTFASTALNSPFAEERGAVFLCWRSCAVHRRVPHVRVTHPNPRGCSAAGQPGRPARGLLCSSSNPAPAGLDQRPGAPSSPYTPANGVLVGCR